MSAPESGGPGDTGGAAASGTTDEVAVAAAHAAIEAADLADPEHIGALGAIRFTEEGAAAAARVIQSGATGDALWAATWIYGASGTDANVLIPLLSTSDSTVRAMAAATLLAWGRGEAADVLVALLSAEGGIRHAEPPVAIAAFAAAALDRFVDGPTIAAASTPEERAAEWSGWLAANGAAMQFDPDTARWHVP